MARQRMLHPDFFTDPKVVYCSPLARILFQGMWCLADREGLLEADPLALKLRILPADRVDIIKLISELVTAGLVLQYMADGVDVLLVKGFKKRQHPHPKEPASTLPRQQPVDLTTAVEKHGEPCKKIASPSESESESESESLTESESIKAYVAEKPATAASELFVVWNSEKPGECPEVASVTPGRIKHAMVRLRETQDLETWRAAIQRLHRSSFCRGLKPDSSWKANIDWLLRPDTLTKIIEGTYDDNPARKPVGKPRFDPDEGLISASHQCSDPACPECGPVLAAAGGA